jgi:MSHA biogenesis protein MshJ
MNDLWQTYSSLFLNITKREKYLIITAGVSVIFLVVFSLFIDENLSESAKLDLKIIKIKQDNSSIKTTTQILANSLLDDVNAPLDDIIEQTNRTILSLDDTLLDLTSRMITPAQMRYALVDLLRLQSTISLKAFSALSVEPLAVKQPAYDTNQVFPSEALSLYKHSVKLVLSGSYFELRDYLASLEQLKWRFFWRAFEYRLIEYPVAELHIEIYSLSTKKEFLGV